MNSGANNNNHKKSTGGFIRNVVNKEFGKVVSAIFSFLMMGVLILLVYLFNIPNPNMILITGLVLCSMMFGFNGGIIAALLMLLYTLFYFSDNHDFITFTATNSVKVWVSIFGITVITLLVSALKQQEIKAFREICELSEQLVVEDEQRQKASVTDTLTGVGNRLALRVDMENYLFRDVCVIMVDIDVFKSVNDMYGNDVGDLMLVLTAKLLTEVFGAECCYRYSGDEFLVIVADPDREKTVADIRSLIDRRPEVPMHGEKVTVDYSIGYHFGRTGDAFSLREMLIDSDRRMYEAKRSGKNRICGDEDPV